MYDVRAPETHTSSRPASDPLELPSLLRPSIEAAIAESEIRGDIPATLPLTEVPLSTAAGATR
jgi:hypothetical protein